MPNKAITEPMGEFTDRYLSRSRAYIAEYESLIKQGKTPKQAADIAWRRVHYDELVQDATAKSMIKAAVTGAGPDVSIGKFDRNFILQKWVDMDDVKLSTTLYRNAETAKQIIADEVQAQLKLGRSYKYAAQFLQDETKVFSAKAPDYLNTLYETGRRALAGDPEALRTLKTEINAVQKQIDRLSASGTTDRLKVNYQKLVDAVSEGNAQAMEQRLERAVMEKARYQAERVARTETARAYGEAKMAVIQADEDSTGWMWVLSSGEGHCETCTFNAEADLHNMGPGVYPLNQGPVYPIHPNDTCLIRPFYKVRDVRQSVDGDAAIDYIQGLSDDRQIALLGNDGYEQFHDNPKSWRDAMGYIAEVLKKPQIQVN
jgi:hypothetical protein